MTTNEVVGYSFDLSDAEKEQLERLLIEKHKFVEDCTITDKEFEDILLAAHKLGLPPVEIAANHTYVDSETGNVVTEGWTCFGGEFFYKNEEAALKKVQEYGFRSLVVASWANTTHGATFQKKFF